MSDWTWRDTPDLSGKVAVVTGANSGLGFECAKAMAIRGASVVLACRSSRKAEHAAAQIGNAAPHARLHALSLDLQDLASIEAFAAAFGRDFNRLDILMNNAGIMGSPYGLTKDGFESQIGTNHLGHFALTGRLLPWLKSSAGARVVTVTSSAHRAGSMNFDDLRFDGGRGYTPMKAYARSKLANLLFTYELQRRFDRHGVECISVAAHPGASQTNLGRHIEGALFFRVFKPVLTRVVPSCAEGAKAQLRAALDSSVRGGQFYGPGGTFELRGNPSLVSSSKAATRQRDAARLWQESERMTDVHYAFATP